MIAGIYARKSTDDVERFSETARRVIRQARDEAERFHHNSVGPEHLLSALLTGNEGIALAVLERLTIRRYAVLEDLNRAMTGLDTSKPGGQIPFNRQALQVIGESIEHARHLGDHFVGTEHLLLGLVCDAESVAARTLSAHGAGPEKVLAETMALAGKRVEPEPNDQPEEEGP